MESTRVIELMLLVLILPHQCVLQELHSAVPSFCPSNRTRVIQREEPRNIVFGEIRTGLVNKYFANVENLTVLNEYFINSGGIYLLPEPVQFNTRLLAVSAIGFPDFTIDVTRDLGPLLPTPVEPKDRLQTLLYVLVYRPNNDGTILSLARSPTQLNHGFAIGRLPSDPSKMLNWDVQEGDRIGVYIPWQCFNRSDGFWMCPSQVNLKTNYCRSALYYHGRDSIENLPVDDFEEVQVWLNVEVLFSAPEENKDVIVAAVVVVLTIVAFCCVVVVVVVACKCCLLKRTAAKQAVLLAAPMPIKAELGSTLKERDQENAFPVVSGEKRPPSYCYISDVPPATGAEDKDGYMMVTSENTAKTPPNGETRLFNNYVLSSGNDQGYDYDYQEPYFEPANQEEELVMQLNSKLAVTEIPRDELELCEVLGSGAFGTVYRGVWSHLTMEGDNKSVIKEEVAVKTVDGKVSETERIKFLQEATIMAQFKHPTVIFLKGVLLENQMMIVLDLMEGGDLRKYLLTTTRKRLNTLESCELGSTLLSFTRQIAQGMIYLQFKSFVHRDLAARNVLVSKDGLICKISDFGLSRELQNENFYVSHGGKIPVKWTAPEALKYHRYSTASDVWSYGCVLYEIWSLGEKPFQEMTNQEAMKHVMAGNRLPPPPGCPRDVYTTMIQCWHPDADQRPCFGVIVQQLQKPDFHILKWSGDDANAYSQEMRKVGAPLHHGKELYKDLQRTYLQTQ